MMIDDYLRRGISIVPLRPNDKKPFGSWGRWSHERMTVAASRDWWGPIHPQPNVGIVGGPISGNLVILDIEPEHVGALDSVEVAMEHPQVETARGGRHIYCSGDLGCGKLRIGGTVVGDVRGYGGYVVAPPSTIGGAAYTWINRPTGWTAAELPPVPAWAESRVRQALDLDTTPVGVRWSPGGILAYMPAALKRSLSGWRRGGAYESASELDFRVVRELIHLHADFDSVRRFFNAMPFGENLAKHSDSYLFDTYRRAYAIVGEELEDSFEVACRRIVVANGTLAGGAKRRIYLEFDDGDGAIVTASMPYELDDERIAGDWAQVCHAYGSDPILDPSIAQHDVWIPAIAKGDRLVRVVRRDVLDHFGIE